MIGQPDDIVGGYVQLTKPPSYYRLVQSVKDVGIEPAHPIRVMVGPTKIEHARHLFIMLLSLYITTHDSHINYVTQTPQPLYQPSESIGRSPILNKRIVLTQKKYSHYTIP